MESCSALLKEPLCIFSSPETVLPGSWQLIKVLKSHCFFAAVKMTLKNIIDLYFDGDDQNTCNAILAPLIDCHDPGRTVSGEPNIFFDFSLSVKAAPHECVIRTGQP